MTAAVLADKALFLGQAILAGILVLGLLVLVHELGHFLVAKACRIRVLTFSIGFGAALWKKNIRGTDYKIGVFPFGGYVHMAGEHPEDTHEASPDEFTQKPIWQRALVGVAGPAANFVFAMFLLWIACMYGVDRERFLDRPVIGAVIDTSVAANAGLQAGDSIVSLNSNPVGSWEDVQKLFIRQDGTYEVAYVRAGAQSTVTLKIPRMKKNDFAGNRTGGILPANPARIGAVSKGSVAEKSGLIAGDSILSMNGAPIYSWSQFSMLVAHYNPSAGPLTIAVARADSVVTISAAPAYDENQKRYLLGIMGAQDSKRKIRYSPWGAIVPSLKKTGEYTFMIFDMLAKLVSKRVSPDQLAGPIGIVQMSGFVFFAGLSQILDFMALIGINLAVINLFPLIITDGGMLLFLLLEAIRRKPLALKHQMLLSKIAISFFILLALYVTFNDIERFPMMMQLLGK
jgi:regulator of sigma E protease